MRSVRPSRPASSSVFAEARRNRRRGSRRLRQSHARAAPRRRRRPQRRRCAGHRASDRGPRRTATASARRRPSMPRRCIVPVTSIPSSSSNLLHSTAPRSPFRRGARGSLPMASDCGPAASGGASRRARCGRWFRDVVVHAGGETGVEVGLHRIGGHRDDRHRREARVRAQRRVAPRPSISGICMSIKIAAYSPGAARAIAPPRGRRPRCRGRCRDAPSSSVATIWLASLSSASSARRPSNSRSSGVRARRCVRRTGAPCDSTTASKSDEAVMGLRQEHVDAELRAPRFLFFAGVRADHDDRQRAGLRPRADRSAASSPLIPGSSQSRTTRPNGPRCPCALRCSNSASPSSPLAAETAGIDHRATASRAAPGWSVVLDDEHRVLGHGGGAPAPARPRRLRPERRGEDERRPTPGALSNARSPPISRASRRLIASPSPVPPYLPRRRAVGLRERVEQLALLLGGDADAGVAHRRSAASHVRRRRRPTRWLDAHQDSPCR